MALEKQIIPVSFADGLDTKTDPKQVLPGKLLLLENGVFNSLKRIKKRNGFRLLGDSVLGQTDPINKGVALATYLSELLLADGTQLYSYSGDLDSWKKQGRFTSLKVEETPVLYNSHTQIFPDSSVNSTTGFTCFVWEDSQGGIRYSFLDTSTHTFLVTNQEVNATGRRPKVVSFGNNHLIFFLVDLGDGTAELRFTPVVASQAGKLAGTVTVASDISTITGVFDVVVVGSQIFTIWTTSTTTWSIKIFNNRFVASAQVDNPGTAATALTLFEVDKASQNVAIAWHNVSHQVVVQVRDNSLAEIIMPATTLDNLSAPLGTPDSNAIHLTGVTFGGPDFNVFYTVLPPLPRSTFVKTVKVLNYVAAAPQFLLQGVNLASKAFMRANLAYVLVSFQSPRQATYFLVSEPEPGSDVGIITAKVLFGRAGTATPQGHLPEVSNILSDRFQICVLGKNRFGSTDALTGLSSAEFDFTDIVAPYRHAELASTIHFAGGFLWMYDGLPPVEHGFHLSPEGILAVDEAGVGATEALLRWNQIAIDASGFDHTVGGGGAQLGPTRASRAMAIVHIAMFEVANAVLGGFQSYVGLTPVVTPQISVAAGIAQAAHDTLAVLFPAQIATFDTALADDIAALSMVGLQAGISLGQTAASSIIAMRAADGSAVPEKHWGIDFALAAGVGIWQEDPISLNTTALGSTWGSVTPFVLSAGNQFRPPVPPLVTSQEYTAAYAEAKSIGEEVSATRTAEQTQIGIFWAYDGTPSLCAPPRLYNQLTTHIAQQQGTRGMALARLLALVNTSMADAAISIWEAKFFYNYWRPITAIRSADDTNPTTVQDPTWAPLGAPGSNTTGPNFTPPFPSYPSGHGGFGGALFETLRQFYGTDNIPFSFVSDEFNGVTIDVNGNLRPEISRSFRNLSQAEDENGESRIFLGIHWRFDKTEAITQGRKVGNEVVGAAFLPNVATLAYAYRVTYEWADNFGQIHISAPSEAFELNRITPISSSSGVVVTVPTLRLTAKLDPKRSPVLITVYRTAIVNNTPTTEFFRVGNVVNDETVDSVTFTDQVADVDAIRLPLLYTTGGILENDPAPPCTSLTVWNNRLAALDSTDPLSVFISQIVQFGAPVEFSLANFLRIDPRGGPVTAIANLDDKLIVFKETLVFFVAGLGPDRTGQQNDFSPPLLVSTDAGCINPRSVVLVPQGLMFQSHKGIYLLGRDLSLRFIGAEVEAFNTAIITSAQLVSSTTRVRFTLDTGSALVYDYFVDQWSVFTNVSAIDSSIFRGDFIYLRLDGSVMLETPGVFNDAGHLIKLRARTGWFSLAGLQGFERAYSLYILGEFASPHELVVGITQDFDPSVFQENTIDAGTLLGQPVYGGDLVYGSGTTYGGTFPLYEWRVDFRKQKCTAFQVTIEDKQLGTPGEGFSLSALGVEVGVKKGLVKLPPFRTFG